MRCGFHATALVVVACLAPACAAAQAPLATSPHPPAGTNTTLGALNAFRSGGRSGAGNAEFTLALSNGPGLPGAQKDAAAWVRVYPGNSPKIVVVLSDSAASPELVQTTVVSLAWAIGGPERRKGRHPSKPFDVYIPERPAYMPLSSPARVKVAEMIAELRAAKRRAVPGVGQLRAVDVSLNRF